VRDVIASAYEGAWLVAFGMFIAGWVAAFSLVGAVLIFGASALCVVLFATRPRPVPLLAFTLVMSLGWYPIFLVAPWLLALPLTLLVVAGWWWQRPRITAR